MRTRKKAQLTGKEHKNILRMASELIVAQIKQTKSQCRNQWFDYYKLTNRNYLLLVAIAALKVQLADKITGKEQLWLTKKLIDAGIINGRIA